MSKALAWLLFATAAHAQSLDIYSEFQRVDPFGAVVAPDRGIGRREILSPAVARNGYASFHIVVSMPQKESYLLYVATNPLDACRVSLYREHFAQTAQGWIPDSLFELERLPDFGTMPDPDDRIAGQTSRVYLLDLWIPPDSPVGRFRLEVQLKVATWIVRPLEIRVLETRIPQLPAAQPRDPASLRSVERSADAPATDMLMRYFVGKTTVAPAQPKTVREILERNAIQDMALAGSLPPQTAGPPVLINRALDLMHKNSSFTPRLFGAEWYLRLRDFLYNR
jgi:hypothetical protein